MNANRILGTKEAARLLGITQVAVGTAIRQGRLKAERISDFTYFIHLDELHDYSLRTKRGRPVKFVPLNS
jgi:hypothetical protein